MRTALLYLPVLLTLIPAHVVTAEERAPRANPDIGASPTKEQVAAWIAQLGDDEYFRREDAQMRLRMAGQSVVPNLQAAATTRDMERKARIAALLEALERDARFDQAFPRLNAKDWPTVEAAVRECMNLCLKDGLLWARLCDAAAKQEPGSVAAAVARWGLKDDNYLNASRAIGMTEAGRSDDDGLNERADRLRAGSRTLKGLFDDCLAAFNAKQSPKQAEAPKDPPAEP